MLASGAQLMAQTDKQIQDKSKGYIETHGLKKTTVRRISMPIPRGSFPLTDSHLVIIDGKFFKGTDPALKSLNKDSIEFVSILKDETSVSGIKEILFYRRKVK